MLRYLGSNATRTSTGEEIGCPTNFAWCATTPPVNVYLYNIVYVLLIGAAFPAINISMNTIYSTLIGPRNQVNHLKLYHVTDCFSQLYDPLLIFNYKELFFFFSGLVPHYRRI